MDARYFAGRDGNSHVDLNERRGSVHRAASAAGCQADDFAVHGEKLRATGGWAVWGGGDVQRSRAQGSGRAGAADRSGEGGGYSADQPGHSSLTIRKTRFSPRVGWSIGPAGIAPIFCRAGWGPK